MKPLDLNVSIQNTYEAARVEQIRLEKEHVLNRLSGQDAMREQRVRDSQVNQPEPKVMHEDMFSAEAYEPPDYTKHGDSEKKKDSRHEKRRQQDSEMVASPAAEEPKTSDENGAAGFSTYA